jgi:hypothetical protein
MPDLLALAQKTAVRRSLRGSSAWTAVAVGAFGFRQLRKLAARKPVVLCEELEPGQSILVIHHPERRR